MMNRRNLLKAAAVAIPAATLAAVGASAWAEDVTTTTADFGILATEQMANKVMFFKKDAAFNNANMYRSFNPGTASGWKDLSDARVRHTAQFGAIGLVTASHGRVGIWNINDEKHQELNDLLWSATPGGNPHALERIPDLGVYVSASSHGYLTVYAPTDVSRPETLAEVQTVPLANAHGVLWDTQNQLLWANGDKIVRAYRVTGSHRNARLEPANNDVVLDGLGHDLMADYSDPNKILVTDTYGAYEIDKTTLALTKFTSDKHLKSYVRHSSGEEFWMQADLQEPRTWGSPTITFKNSGKRTLEGGQFYKARFDIPDYN